MREGTQSRVETKSGPSAVSTGPEAEPIAIIGMGCRLPGDFGLRHGRSANRAERCRCQDGTCQAMHGVDWKHLQVSSVVVSPLPPP